MSWGPETLHAPAPAEATSLEPPRDDPWFRNGGVRAKCPLPWHAQADRSPLPWAVEVDA